MPKFCPTCYLPENQLDTCSRDDFGIPCPQPVEADPEKDVTIKCGPCGFTRVVPLPDLLSGKTKNELPVCHSDECACKLVPPEAPKSKPVPAKKAPKPEEKPQREFGGSDTKE